MAYADRRKERINKIISEVYKRIDSDILSEAPTAGVKIGIDDLMKTNPDQLSKLAQKSTINVVDKVQEAGEDTIIDVTNDIIVNNRKVYVLVDVAQPGDQVEFTSKGKKYTAIVSDEPKGTSEDKRLLKDIKKVSTEEPEAETTPDASKEKEQVADSQQQQAVFNLKNWAVQLQVPINEGEPTMNGAIKFTYFSQEGQLPINILVLSNGLIKMSGHVIQDFEDFKNIVEFHKEA